VDLAFVVIILFFILLKKNKMFLAYKEANSFIVRDGKNWKDFFPGA